MSFVEDNECPAWKSHSHFLKNTFSAGKSRWEGDIGSDGFTWSEALTYKSGVLQMSFVGDNECPAGKSHSHLLKNTFSAGKSRWEGDIGSDGFTWSEALT